MKKFATAFLSVAAAASLCSAATPRILTADAQRARAIGVCIDGRAVLRTDDAALSKAAPRKAPVKRAAVSADVPEILYDTPEGEMRMYSRDGDGYTEVDGYIVPDSQHGYFLKMVYAPDGTTVYMYNPIASCYMAEAWVKGSTDGTTVTIPTGQYLAYSEEMGYGLTLEAGKLTETTNEYGDVDVTYMRDESVKEINFTVGADGVLTIDSKFCHDDPDEPAQNVVGAFYDDDGTWGAYTMYNSRYTPFDDVAVSAPEGTVFEDWAMTSVDFNEGGRKVTFVKAAVSGDKMYLSNLDPVFPDAVMEGTVEGDKVTFSTNQFMGIYMDLYLTYFVADRYSVETIYDEEYDEEYEQLVNRMADKLVMSYDAGARTLTSAEGDGIIINAGKGVADDESSLGFLDIYFNPVLQGFDEVAATPATPRVVQFFDGFEDYGESLACIELPLTDADGNILNYNKLSYAIYTRVDDVEEPFVFYPDEYPGLAEYGLDELTEVPYTMTVYNEYGYEDIAQGGSMVYFYTQSPDAIGVKSIYTGGGERRESPISWYDVAGVKAPSISGAPAVTEVYGPDGIRRSAPVRGLNIVKMSDGSVRKVVVR